MTLTEEITSALIVTWNIRAGSWPSTTAMLQELAAAAAHAAEHHDSTLVEPDEAITALRQQLDVVRLQLSGTVMATCPGLHRPVQHRDRQPPWCKACGLTAEGQRIAEAAR